MNRNIFLAILPPFFFFLSGVAQEKSPPGTSDCLHTPSTFRCVKFIDNYDGDTLTVTIPGLHPLFGHKMKVRLKGLDTAELKTKNKCELDKARLAKKLTHSLLRQAKRVDLLEVQREKYFRILAKVSVDGRDLGEILLSQHLARVYDGGTKNLKSWCP